VVTLQYEPVNKRHEFYILVCANADLKEKQIFKKAFGVVEAKRKLSPNDFQKAHTLRERKVLQGPRMGLLMRRAFKKVFSKNCKFKSFGIWLCKNES